MDESAVGEQLGISLQDSAEELHFDRIKGSERLFQRVVDEIDAKIIAGELKPGAMLPPERVLAKQFGVSRTVIREATKILELRGVIEVQHGRGAIVVKLSPDRVADSVVRFLKTESSPLSALLELRTILEVEIAALAAERATEEDLDQLADLLVEMGERLDNPSEYVELDMEFHRGLWNAAHNQLFPLVLEPFMTLMRESRRLGATAPNAPRRSIEIHRKILYAVRARNQTEARQIMREHFVQVAEFLSEGSAYDEFKDSGV